MGQLASCKACGFSFLGGHSHQSRDSACICLSCKFCLSCPTQSAWGPEVNEEIEVCRLVTSGKRKAKKTTRIPTGVRFKTEQGISFQLEDRTAFLYHCSIDPVACPDCGASTLKMGFENEDACPVCNSGKLEVSPVIY